MLVEWLHFAKRLKVEKLLRSEIIVTEHVEHPVFEFREKQRGPQSQELMRNILSKTTFIYKYDSPMWNMNPQLNKNVYKFFSNPEGVVIK